MLKFLNFSNVFASEEIKLHGIDVIKKLASHEGGFSISLLFKWVQRSFGSLLRTDHHQTLVFFFFISALIFRANIDVLILKFHLNGRVFLRSGSYCNTLDPTIGKPDCTTGCSVLEGRTVTEEKALTLLLPK